MTFLAAPAAGMHLFYLDGEGVLFSEATQDLHLLNPTATLIWSLLEEGHDADSASAALRELHGLDADRCRQLVVAALAEWRDKGFLEGSPKDQPAHRPIAPPAVTPASSPTWTQPKVVEERHYRMLGSGFRLCFSSVAQAQMVHPVIEHLEVPAPSPNETAVDIVETANRLLVFRDREFVAECADIIELAPIVYSLVWVTAVNNHEFFLDIHAGVVGDGAKCVLLPGPQGSGKSTLTASLVHAGFQYFSDEVALLEEGSFNVFPVPLAICVKAAGIDALAPRFANLRGLQLHQRADGKRVAYMPLAPEFRPASDDARPVAALVFPQYTPGTPTSLLRLSTCDALKRLLDECLVVRSALDFTKVAGLVQWISRVPCYRLSFRSTEDAVAEVRSVFGARAETAQVARDVHESSRQFALPGSGVDGD